MTAVTRLAETIALGVANIDLILLVVFKAVFVYYPQAFSKLHAYRFQEEFCIVSLNCSNLQNCIYIARNFEINKLQNLV